ncbi:MAG TPA: hypothetical protein VH437_15410 [Terriglobales bacterium]|jgi:hypothetical protein
MRHWRLGIAFLLAATINLFAGDFGRGSKISVRISDTVSSDRSLIGDPVDGVLVNDLSVNGKLIAPAGSRAHGIVSAAEHSVQGKATFPGSVSIRLETIDTEKGAYHLSTNQYTREGRGRSNSPFPGGSTTGVSIDSVGGVHPHSPVPQLPDPTEITVATGGLEAIIPAQSVLTFKAVSIAVPKP